jgi:hypothetical protein
LISWALLHVECPFTGDADQLIIGFNVEFLFDALAVSFNGVPAQADALGDFIQIQPLTNMLKDLKFSV